MSPPAKLTASRPTAPPIFRYRLSFVNESIVSRFDFGCLINTSSFFASSTVSARDSVKCIKHQKVKTRWASHHRVFTVRVSIDLHLVCREHVQNPSAPLGPNEEPASAVYPRSQSGTF